MHFLTAKRNPLLLHCLIVQHFWSANYFSNNNIFAKKVHTQQPASESIMDKHSFWDDVNRRNTENLQYSRINLWSCYLAVVTGLYLCVHTTRWKAVQICCKYKKQTVWFFETFCGTEMNYATETAHFNDQLNIANHFNWCHETTRFMNFS